MLGMRMRMGPNLSFGASCGPIEALRGDYDGDEINVHLPQGPHVTCELKHLMSVSVRPSAETHTHTRPKPIRS